ncbi:MAG TPA: cupin domain-containing protein [Thermodesulfobacteriota bacterium]|nr:cupin domain-containing protein [Thermodesulfobacteriota bacterium]
MNTQTHKPAVLQSNEGRKMTVLGMEVTLKLASTETAGDYYLFEIVVPPGLGVPPHFHEREDEILKVMDGEFEVFLDGKTYKAASGAVAYFPRNVVHGFSNTGKTLGRAMFFVSPARILKNSLKNWAHCQPINHQTWPKLGRFLTAMRSELSPNRRLRHKWGANCAA